MGRSTLTAAMVGKTIGELVKSGKTPQEYQKYGTDMQEIFSAVAELEKIYGEDWKKIPPSALGVYAYFDRLATGLKQFMAGVRKFSLEYIDRSDLICLTEEASKISGLPYVMDMDYEESMKILEG